MTSSVPGQDDRAAPAPPGPYLTAEQAAALLPRGKADWVRAQLRRGTLRGSKVGGTWLTTEAWVHEMVEAGSNVERRRRRRMWSG